MCVKCYGTVIHIPWFTGLSRSTLATLSEPWILVFLSAICGAIWDCLWPCFLPSLVLASQSWSDMFQLVFNTFAWASGRQQVFSLATPCQVPAPGTRFLCTKHLEQSSHALAGLTVQAVTNASGVKPYMGTHLCLPVPCSLPSSLANSV